MKRLTSLLAACLMIATAAHAQSQSMGGGGGGGRRGKSRAPASSPATPTTDAPTPAAKPPAKIEIVGVVTALDPQTDRITITYDAVEALNLPAGTRPFIASKDSLLNGVTVGEKVRFSLESQQISELKPF
jgi:Cu/Ag efflux protein CusF